MTVEPFAPAPIYTVAGIGPYSVPHPYRPGAIRVEVLTDTAVLPLLPPVDWQATPAGNEVAGGSVFLSAAAAAAHAGRQLRIRRDTTEAQGWQGRAGERERSLEVQLDSIVMALQEHDATLRRTLRATTDQPERPPLAGGFVAFDADGRLRIVPPDELPEGPAGPPGEWSEVNNFVPFSHIGDGTAAAITLPIAVPGTAQIFVWIDGLWLDRQFYTASGTTLTPLVAIPVGARVSGLIARPGPITTVAAGEVTTTAGTNVQQEIDRRGIVFPSRAAAAATHVPAPVVKITVLQPEGMALDFIADANGTALTTNGGARKWSPAGVPSPAHFAENTVPGTTDMTAAVLAAIEFADTQGSEALLETIGSVVDGRGEVFAISSRIQLGAVVGVTVQHCSFVAIGTWAADLSLFRIFRESETGARRYIKFVEVLFEGSHKTNAVLVDNASGCEILNCRIHGVPNYAVRTRTKATELRIEGCKIQQFYWGEVGFDIEENRTAVLLDIATADYMIYGNVLNYAFEPFRITTQGPGQFKGNHVYNGFLQSVTFQSRCGTISAPNVLVIGNYFDNGILRLDAAQIDATGLVITGNIFHRNANGGNTHDIEIFGGVDSDLDGLVLSGNLFNSTANAILYTGTYKPMNDRKWAVAGNVAKNGGNILGLPEISGRDVFFADVVEGFQYTAEVHTYRTWTGPVTNLRFERSVSIDADFNNNSGASESEGTLRVHGLEKLKWKEAGVDLTGAVTINGLTVWGTRVTVADDAVVTLTPVRRGGVMSITCGGLSSGVNEALSVDIAFDTFAPVNAEKSTAFPGRGASVDTSTAVLTGTTGVDGRVTVSPQTDGTVLIENRSGVSQTFNIFVR